MYVLLALLLLAPFAEEQNKNQFSPHEVFANQCANTCHAFRGFVVRDYVPDVSKVAVDTRTASDDDILERIDRFVPSLSEKNKQELLRYIRSLEKNQTKGGR